MPCVASQCPSRDYCVLLGSLFGIAYNQPYATAENLAGMLHAYLLHQLSLLVVQLVHVAVYLVKADVLMEVRLQIVCRGRLAQRLADAGYDKMAKHLVPYPVKTDAVIDLV